MSLNESSSSGNGLYLTKLLAKEDPGRPQTTQATAKIIGYAPQNDGKTALQETTTTQLTEHGEVKLVSF